MTKPVRIYLIHQYSRDLAVPSGSILMSTGCYLVQTDDRRNILIDSGMPVDADGSDPPTEESAGILAQLRELRVRPEDVEVVHDGEQWRKLRRAPEAYEVIAPRLPGKSGHP